MPKTAINAKNDLRTAESDAASPHAARDIPQPQPKNENSVLLMAEHPPLAEYFLKRPAVECLLQTSFEKPLTTVIAGAGYGKTQAVLAALQTVECNAAWIQLSELDNHVARLWERIAGAFEPQSRNLYNSLISLGYPESIASFDQFLRLLARDLTQTQRFILVFDDFHLIHNKMILSFIELFISACVQRFSIVLISRKKPDLSLSGMLSKGLLARVTEDDLRFSIDEMIAYYNIQGVKFDEVTALNICNYTDGWIFAMYLVGLAAKKGNIHHQNPVLPAKIDIFDLIEREIFSAASKELQDFLIKISMLNVIPAGLLRELANNNFSIVSEMIQISMFIRYDSCSDNYYIHHLFKDFLQEKKSWLTNLDISETHKKAAEWYCRSDDKFEAIAHYKQIGYYEEIFDIIISIPGRVPSEAADEIVALIENAPKGALAARPIMRVAKAGYLFNNNKLDEAKLVLAELREEFEALPQTEETRLILGETYLMRALICIVDCDYAFEELYRMADELLPNGSKLVDYRMGIAEGINVCSINNPAAGELQRHQEALFRVFPLAAKAMNGCGYGAEYLNAAESSLFTADLKSAEKYAYETIYRSKQYEQYDMEYMADLVLVRIFTAKGNYEKVTGILDQMKSQLENHQYVDCAALYDMISGWFYAKVGRTDLVAKWIMREEEARNIFAPVVIGRDYQVRSDSLMAEERYTELLALIEQTDRIYETRGILFALLQNRIMKAIVHHYMGNHEDSVINLTAAYEIAHPNDLIMQFIEYGNRMRTLIHAARQDDKCKIPREWLDRIYTKSSSYSKMLSQIVAEFNGVNSANNPSQISLSKRESDVLSSLCSGMTRKEIASSSYISLSTVNSVIKNIYDKLGAANIAEAVRIARERGFV